MRAFPALLRSVLLALVCLTTAAAQAPPRGDESAADVETDVHLLPCPTCGGDGQVDTLCPYCRGAKKTCTQSGYQHPPYPRRWQAAWLPDAWWHLLQELVLRDLDGMVPWKENLVRHLGQRAEQPEPTRQRAHEIRCPAGCEDGKLPLNGGLVDCRLCTRGKQACPTCLRRPSRCPPCDGRGVLSASCPDCAGSRMLLDPRRTDPLLCPWSGAASERDCGSCDEEGRMRFACLSCGGHGMVFCVACQGLGRIPCPGCGGRGRLLSGRCLTCSGQGALPCLECVAGSRTCVTCAGTATVLVTCPHCGGTRKHPCNGCSDGSYAAWEHAAAWCLDLHRPDRAAVLLEVALARCAARYGSVSYPPHLDCGDERFEQFLSSMLARGGASVRLQFEEARDEEQREELHRLTTLFRKARRAAE